MLNVNFRVHGAGEISGVAENAFTKAHFFLVKLDRLRVEQSLN